MTTCSSNARCQEIRVVMAHEMGHYVLNHGIKLIIYQSLFILGAFAIARAIFERAVRRWGKRWGVHGIADPAGFPLLILIFSTYFSYHPTAQHGGAE